MSLILDVIQLEITKDCNLSCEFCRNEKEFRNLPYSQFQKILKEIKKSTITHIALTGGEPTLHPRITQFIDDLNNQGFCITLISNGTNIAIDLLTRILCGKVSLAISIHSHCPDKHDRIVGEKGSWGKTVRNLEILHNNKINVIINHTITKSNYKEVYKFIEYFSKFSNVVLFNFNKYIPKLGLSKELSIGIEEIKFSLSLLHSAYLYFGVEIFLDAVPLCKIPSKYHYLIQGCIAGTKYLFVDIYGNVKVCVFSDLLIGNLVQNPHILNIYSELMQSNLRNYLPIEKKCNNCKLYLKCGGGCPFFLDKNGYNFRSESLLCEKCHNRQN